MNCKHENKKSIRRTKDTPYEKVRRYKCKDCGDKFSSVEILLPADTVIPKWIKKIENSTTRKRIKDFYRVIDALKIAGEVDSKGLSDFILKAG